MLKKTEKKSQKVGDQYTLFLQKLPTDKFAVTLGFLVIFLFSIFIVYFGTVRVIEIKRFYPVYFKVDFLAGIEAGMKVRYQGGVVVGEVVEVISEYSSHTLYAKIDKKFFIPKQGTKVTLRSYGFFGKLYIDITSVAKPFETALYKPNDIIEVSATPPLEETLQQFSELIHESEDGSIAPLSAKLISIRNMIKHFRQNQYANPRYVRENVANFSHSVQDNLKNLQSFSLGTYEAVNDLYVSLDEMAENLRKNLPILYKRINTIKEYAEYRDINGKSSMLHDELMYWTILNNIKTFHRKLKIYKEEPHKLFF